ncbi:acetyl-CoA carboxylase biotin carboxyl carrier protein [Paraburkholderia fungorum]|uniref:acetyl-CoA carboxylase biotin carboxyl carrier protein n=1 Tax=Paraburkholderia fungorum TaxID=134537 RepID=UPI0038B9A318
MTLSHADVRRILEILDTAANLESLDITVGEFELHARKPGAVRSIRQPATQAAVVRAIEAATPAADAPTAVAEVEAPLAEAPPGLIAVRAPMVGTFYLRPSPDQPPFVAVGSVVQAGDTVCLVEVMKMFNSVQAHAGGTVERILISDGKPVQHDQIVMLIKPAQEG